MPSYHSSVKLEKIDFQKSKILKKFSCTLPQEIMENDALQQIKEFKQKERETETHVAPRKQGIQQRQRGYQFWIFFSHKIKYKQRHYFTNKGPSSQSYDFSSSHVWMWELDDKAEHQKTDAFELWCWRRLSRVPWTTRRSNQSILKEISPGCSLEGLTLKLKLQNFGHLMRRADSFE